MESRHCAICGELVAVREKGSKVKTGAVLLCPDCWGENKQAKVEPVYGEDVPDFLKKLFGRRA